jgi:hypothetical protein
MFRTRRLTIRPSKVKARGSMAARRPKPAAARADILARLDGGGFSSPAARRCGAFKVAFFSLYFTSRP